MLVPSKGRAPLVGRETEIETLAGLLDDVDHAGAALVLRGDPGIGKSRLLAEVASIARERGFSVLSATGVQCETRLAFSGLHQLLRPVKDRAVELIPAQRAALDAAFGLTDGAAPDRFRAVQTVARSQPCREARRTIQSQTSVQTFKIRSLRSG